MTFEELHAEAHRKGMIALTHACPTPMGLIDCDIMGNPKPNARMYVVNEGACGFAWVAFKGNTPWGRWAKKSGIARPKYGGGLQLWVSEGGQSVERKEAYANAYAKSLNDHGIEAYADSRLD